MKYSLSYRSKNLLLSIILFLIATNVRAALEPKDTTSYEDCLARVASQYAGSQVNDQCFIYFDKFIAVPNPVSAGKIIYIDQAHNNFHQRDGRYLPFTKLMQKDGYTVEVFSEKFTDAALAKIRAGDVLVIANPSNDANYPEKNWIAPIYSAFTDGEIDALVKWVGAGGSLMLIADHFPFPGSVDKLAQRFGFFMDNGYNFDPNYNDVFLHDLLNSQIAKDIMRQLYTTKDPSPQGGTKFNKKLGIDQPRTIKDDLVDQVRAVLIELSIEVNALLFWAGDQPSVDNGLSTGDGWLLDHPIVRGLNNYNHKIPYVTSYVGQSFLYIQPSETNHKNFVELMRFGNGTYTLLTTAQDAYCGVDNDESDNNLVNAALSEQKFAAYTVDKVDTSPTPIKDSSGKVTGYKYKLQGAALDVGNGKLAVFGEAGMFTAQIAGNGRSQMGFNNPMAANNQQFALNTMHWLDGSLNQTTQAKTPSTNTGLTPELKAKAKLVLEKAQANRDDQEARKNNVVDGMESYGAQYQREYDGTNPGGCSISNGKDKFDPILLLLIVVAAGYLVVRRYEKQKNY